MKAVELLRIWTPEIEAKVTGILNNPPAFDLDFKSWTPRPYRRQEALCAPKK